MPEAFTFRTGFPEPARFARLWAPGWAIAAFGILLPSEIAVWPRVVLALTGLLVTGIVSGRLVSGLATGRRRAWAVPFHAVAWLAGMGLFALLRPALLETHELFGLHAGAAAAGALVGGLSALATTAESSGSNVAWPVLRPLVVGVVWAMIFALALQICILGWYLLGQVVLKPLLGAVAGFSLAALIGGACGGGFAGYFCGLALGFGSR